MQRASLHIASLEVFRMDLSSLVSLASYIVLALGLYWMGQACGVKYPWLSFVPVARSYALGTVAEKSAGRGTNESKPYRKILLGLLIAVMALALVAACVAVVLALGVLADLPWDWEQLMSDPDYLVDWILYVVEDSSEMSAMMEVLMNNLAPLLILVAVGLILAVVSVIYTVFYFICLWHVFNLYDEKNAKLWLLLSVLCKMIVPYSIGELVGPIIVMVLSLTKKPDFKNDDPDDEPTAAPNGPAPWESV